MYSTKTSQLNLPPVLYFKKEIQRLLIRQIIFLETIKKIGIFSPRINLFENSFCLKFKTIRIKFAVPLILHVKLSSPD